MKFFITISFLLITTCCFSQFKPRNVLEKEFFIGSWQLTEVRTGNISSKPTEIKIIRFTKDSIFVTSGTKQLQGTWILKKSQLYITIPGTTAFNYKWVNIAQSIISLRIGEDFSRIEYFSKK